MAILHNVGDRFYSKVSGVLTVFSTDFCIGKAQPTKFNALSDKDFGVYFAHNHTREQLSSNINEAIRRGDLIKLD